jgi:uncharacterized protein with HEPN domain
MSRDPSLLLDMLNECRNAREFVAGMTREGFETDLKTQYAVVRALEIVGEAAGTVSDVTQAEYPEIDWRNLVNLRNRLIHQYSRVDLDVIWDIATLELDELILQLERIVPAEDTE